MKTILPLLSCAFAMLCGTTVPYASTPPSGTQQLTSPGQVPEGLATSDWSSIRAAYEAGRHAFQPTTTGWQARNPGQQWITKFDGRGFIAEPRDSAWQWGLELQCYGFGEEQHAIGGTSAVKAEGQRLSYQWDATVQEWWLNDARGLEHGFTVQKRPKENPNSKSQTPLPPLSLTLRTRGTLHPRVSSDAQGVLFQDASGTTLLNYSGLKVWDADGRVLASHFVPARGGVRLLVEERGARYPLTIDPIAQQAFLKPAAVGTTQVDDNFGSSVAVSGDTVVIGAPYENSSTTGVNSTPDEAGSNFGAVYVFVRNAGVWTQQAYLKPAWISGGTFGSSVALAGDTLVVGAPNENSSTTGVNSVPNYDASQAGAAFVFVRSGGEWSQQAYLKPAAVGTSQAYDRFGRSVAVSGETVVVGAPDEDSSTTGVNSTPNDAGAPTCCVNFFNSGAAYIFVRNAGVWTQQAYLKPVVVGATQEGDHFGQSVAVSGDTVVIGALSESSSSTGVNSTPNENADGSGAAYVFVRSGTNWAQLAYLKPAAVGTTQAGDGFGRSVGVSGDTVVVGASAEDSSSTGVNSTPNDSGTSNGGFYPFNSGAAYVFVRSGTSWMQQAYLKPAAVGTTQGNDVFGTSVAVSGDSVVIGALGEDSSTTDVNSTPNENASVAGAAYVFVRSAGVWTQQAYLKPAAAGATQASDQFGTSVAVSGDTVVVGAPYEDSSTTGVNSTPNESASGSGAAYIFTGLVVPEIAVEQPAGTNIADGAAVSFGTVDPGGDAVLTFTIRNSGPADLTGVNVGITGADAGSFTVSSAPAATVPGPGGSTTFSVKFAPLTPGQKTAALRIFSNDGDESPYDISLTGTASPFGTEAVIVSWNRNWNYMMPMGLDPALADVDFNTTWFLKAAEFDARYNGPPFGGPTVAGNAADASSINHGSGPGPLGYDVIDYFATPGAEVLSLGTTLTAPASGNRYSAYFRTTFTTSRSYVSPIVRMILDDGALVYLDGVLVAQVNMNDNTESYTSSAADSVAGLNETGTPNLNDEACIQSFSLGTAGTGSQADSLVMVPVSSLAAGEHTLAVSVRNNGTSSSDLCMGLQLLANDTGIAATASNIQRHENGAGIVDDTFTFDVTVAAFNMPGAVSWFSDNPAGNGPVSGSYAPATFTYTYPAMLNAEVLNRATINFHDGINPALTTTLVVTAPALPSGPPVVWGRGNNGQMGDGTTATRILPGAVNTSGVLAAKSLVAIAAGEGHSIVLTADGKVFAWGYNFFGQMGNGTTVTNQPLPVAIYTGGVLAGKTITAIKAGLHHCLVLTSDGKLYSWGHNDSYVLGDGTTTQRNLPVAVNMTGALAGKTVKAIAAGYLHNVVLTTDGKLYAWGENSSGQVGDSTFTTRSTPVAVTMTGVLAGRTVTGIAVGREHSLAFTSDGKVFAWGLNGSGQLGDGSTTNRNAPVAVNMSGALSGKFVTAVDAGYAQTLVLTSGNQLFSWGSNVAGQLGDGTTVSHFLPAEVSTIGALAGKTPVAIAAGRDHCVVLTSDGRVFAWGDNTYGQLGDGTNIMRTSAVPVLSSGTPTGRTVALVDAGTGFTNTLTGLTALEGWRASHFGFIVPTGPAADNADPDKDGLENLVEFGFGLNPNLPDAAGLPSWQLSDDDYALTFTRPANVSGITYIAEYSTSLAPGSWTTVPNSSTPPIYSFLAPAVTQRLYLRLRVTVP